MSLPTTPSEVPDVARENAVFRKVVRRIVPFLILCYVVSYLDRVNVGFAKLQMSDDLGFSEAAYGLGAGLFFIGYFLFEVPSNLLLQRFGARIWIARIMISWGLVSASFMFVNNEATFYVLRFLLGARRGRLLPGRDPLLHLLVPLPPSRPGDRAVHVGDPGRRHLRQPALRLDHGRLPRARRLAGLAVDVPARGHPGRRSSASGPLFYLDNSVRAAKWLTDDEKAVVERAIAEDAAHQTVHGRVWDGFSDPKVWLMCLIYFCFVMGQYALTFWMPTFIESTGIEGHLAIGVLSAIPFLAALVAMNLFGRSADQRRERRWHLVIPA